MTRTSPNGGVDHIHKKVTNDENTRLTAEEAKEQLLYDLRDQLGHITFDVVPNSELDAPARGDGIVIAKINGGQVDHYIYEENES